MSDAAGVVAVSTPSGYCAWQPGGDLQGFEPARSTQVYGPIALDAAGTTVVTGSEWNGGGITEIVDFESFEPERTSSRLPGPPTAVRIGEDGTVVVG